ncbi:hypothetical protein [Desulfitibacter alkalitolerans]|uniref:hypothetical protein n=1 Tax=Desulfitibacter alkalitolerans TaxID=264641 RepID=UPI000488EA77|nr:hypothetical protein [Desulfitibacter alkalitolerans]
MRIKGFSLPVIIIAFILTLGILISINWVYTEMAIKKPLGQQLSEVDGVKGYTIENGPEKMVLTVELGLVDNIETSYMSLSEIAQSHFKNSEGYEFRIIDNPNKQLITLWNEIQYYAHQSLVQGDFVTLKESLESIAKDNEGVNYQVHINETHLFIQVQSHDEYIYRILERTK